MTGLFARPRRVVAPGAVHVPDWLTVAEQRQLVEACRGWATEGPGIRAATMPNGARTSVKTVCLGWHWIPYRYSRTRDDQDGSPVTPFPDSLVALGRRAVADAYADPARAATYTPDVALINYYNLDARLGLHRDSDERAPDPVVSLSLGAACVFRLGNAETRDHGDRSTHHSSPSHSVRGGRPARGSRWVDLTVASGDLVVFGDESRLAYHGVPRLLPELDVPDVGLAQGRLNITLRVSGLGLQPDGPGRGSA